MKSNFMIEDNILTNISVEDIGNDHLFTSLETPMVANAFSKSDTEKRKLLLFILLKL